ncbi:type II CAAX endopeptidase family protein [Mycolicibacterium neoaurum]|uniref:CPBP family intramembrane glutamic endopeptidase n=1 Tax=Mycolicibacterium neoaurum TaxID=1795 RepID=UPI00248D2623|nr:type II CAAX endopeptidase family protein [Mycolicibacterium neoaurum]WBP94036.1 type II CAAX endopeptidase family protein [Mycolicibacterium neoaurum]WBS07174.1 type II CAAX endopeptidase family protein [Mycolicibacterium neoaurum]
MSGTADARRVSVQWIPSAVIAVGLVIYLAAALAVYVGAAGQIRFTADSSATIPMWHLWLAAAVGIALTLVALPQRSRPVLATSRDRVDAVVLTLLAVAFATLLVLLGPTEPNYTVVKVVLLVIFPLLLFAVGRRREPVSAFVAEPQPGHRWCPWIPVLGWATTHLVLSAPGPAHRVDIDWVTLVVGLVLGFVINAVVEEFFYRRWLQTRWARVLGGTWPAIIVSSLLWASWHIAIQGGGDLGMDLANTIVNQGVTGLFLGLLWARGQAMWPVLVTHGVMNANPMVLFG